MSLQRAQYPAWWPELAQDAKEAAGWRCAGCGALHGSLAVSQRNRFYRVVLAAYHLDHDPANPELRLAVNCQACHLRYDAFQRWRSRRRNLRAQGVAAGQLEFDAGSA
jgi:hypothetical protein